MPATGLAALLVAVAALFAARRRRREQLPGQTVIMSPRRSTVIGSDGAVRSVQSAEVTLSERDLERLWLPVNLQHLARTYWRFLSKVTLGLIQVRYGENERAVKLVWPRVTLLRFDPPQYEVQPDRGHVHWRIRDGLLVARAGREKGILALDVRRLGAPEDGRGKLRIEVEVSNFYPSIASGFSMPVYRITQAFIHVLVTHAFLRSLATLDLAQSQLTPFVDAAEPAGDLAAAGNGAGPRSDQP